MPVGYRRPGPGETARVRMTAGRSGNNGKDAAKLVSSETGLRIDLLRKPDCDADLQLCGSVSGYRNCYRVSYRVLAHGAASTGGSAAWLPWLRLKPPKMAPFFAAPNKAKTIEQVVKDRWPTRGPQNSGSELL
jgi:hypothetical protein